MAPIWSGPGARPGCLRICPEPVGVEHIRIYHNVYGLAFLVRTGLIHVVEECADDQVPNEESQLRNAHRVANLA